MRRTWGIFPILSNWTRLRARWHVRVAAVVGGRRKQGQGIEVRHSAFVLRRLTACLPRTTNSERRPPMTIPLRPLRHATATRNHPSPKRKTSPGGMDPRETPVASLESSLGGHRRLSPADASLIAGRDRVSPACYFLLPIRYSLPQSQFSGFMNHHHLSVRLLNLRFQYPSSQTNWALRHPSGTCG